MENNLENKAKFFALYYGQKVYKHQTWSNVDIRSEVNPTRIINCANGFLELKPLSSITDEDAIALGNVLGLKRSVIANVKDYLENHKYGDSIEQPELDYLRSKGYAVPWMGLSIAQLKEYGWIKLVDNGALDL